MSFVLIFTDDPTHTAPGKCWRTRCGRSRTGVRRARAVASGGCGSDRGMGRGRGFDCTERKTILR